MLVPASSRIPDEIHCHHLLPLLSWTVTADVMKLLWLLDGWRRPAGMHTYMAAPHLMSPHMWSQQGKGMPALLIPLYWPYVSAGFQCRGLHPERLKRQKQPREKTDRRARFCLKMLLQADKSSQGYQTVLFTFIHMNLSTSLLLFLNERKTNIYTFSFLIRKETNSRWVDNNNPLIL